MSTLLTLSQGSHYIHFILPSIKIYYKLDTLLTNISTTNSNEQRVIVIAVEHINQKRHFLSLTIDELSKLLHFLEPPKQKSLSLNIHESLKILQTLFHVAIANCTNELTNHSTSIADHFLVLTASTPLKHRYHLIYTNTMVRFQSQQTVFKFITTVLYHCSHFIRSHSCHQNLLKSINTHTEKHLNNCLQDLQTILSHTNFCNCIIPTTPITCNNFQKLLYKNSNDIYQWIFDIKVYNNNQQFRLFKATKSGKDNPLVITNDFPFNQQLDIFTANLNNSDFILNHALLSYTINNPKLLIVSYNDNK
ncbi:unnamed protein product [Adineta steineri]|uniref:Uncharacterized protein n=1 Tax=Adineta steineri TaxID=433720 RepID=A0A819IQD7_9BILA|nr:unnamed protein product [Adineta steineri]CAF3917208.1 unnamed protein product [Adineta steineri]